MTHEEWLLSDDPADVISFSLKSGLPRTVAVFLAAKIASTIDVSPELEIPFAWFMEVAGRWSTGEQTDEQEIAAMSMALSLSVGPYGPFGVANIGLSLSYAADAMTRKTDQSFIYDLSVAFAGLGYMDGKSISDEIRLAIPFDSPSECKLILGRIVHPLVLMSQPEDVQVAWDASFGSF